MANPPSKPVAIGSPTSTRIESNNNLLSTSYASHRDSQLNDVPVSASPRPDLERFRELYSGTPPPNIPPRPLGPVSSSPFRPAPSAAVPGAPSFGSGTPRSTTALSSAGGPLGRQSPFGSRPQTPRNDNPSPYARPDSPASFLAVGAETGQPSNPVADPFNLDELPDEEKARVLRKHLVSRDQRLGPESDAGSISRGVPSGGVAIQGPEVGSSRASIAQSTKHLQQDTEPFPIPYNAPGGDITHDIYKWQADHRRLTGERRSRSVSFPARRSNADPTFEHIREPGGFRRNYILLKANEQGIEQPRMLRNFIDFLYIFGHFAGEDLEEEDEDEDEDESEERPYDGTPLPTDDEAFLGGVPGPSALVPSGLRSRAHVPFSHEDLDKPVESTPLIRTVSTSRIRDTGKTRRSRRSSVGPHGDATVAQAVLMLLKAFIGTGVLFLGKAFYNGGMVFSAVTLVFIAAISLHSFLLLVRTKFVVSGSFGDIGGVLYGPWMRTAILSSITISQIGFVAAYTIFVAQNLQAFVMAVTDCARIVPIFYLILVQLVVFLPLALVRNLAKLSTTALIADAFILIGLIYIGSNEIAVIAERGFAPVKMFNPKDFPLLIGTAVFSFEGIGLIIPITDSMREPRKFPATLSVVMIFLTVLFGGAGALSYAAYGDEIQTVVIVNLPQDQKFVQVVQFLYSMAILLSAPLQLFPALRIMENGIWTRSGKVHPRVKWEKNAFRLFVVLGCTLLSWAGAKDLDKFVSFVGSFCCIPLCYIYPPLLHLKAVAKTRFQRWSDCLLIFFGFIATIYTSVGTIQLMLEPSKEGPQFGRCSTTEPDIPALLHL